MDTLLPKDSTLVLFLPEILSVIFSFLSQHTLSSVQFVCKRWRSVSAHLVRISATWSSPSSGSVQSLIDRVHTVTNLSIHFGYYNTKDSLDWRLFMEKFNFLKASNQLRLSNLTVYSENSPSLFTYPIFTNTLTEIQLRTMAAGSVNIDDILSLCPKLRRVNIEFRPGGPFDNFDKPVSWLGTTPKFRESDVVSVVIKGMYVTQTYLERVLRSCPKLQELKLVDVVDGDIHTMPFDNLGFLIAVSASCPLLRSFHFSISERNISPDDIVAQCEYLFPNTQPSISAESGQTISTRNQRRHLPLDTVSVMDRYVNENTSQALFAPFRYTPCLVTVLEIFHSPHGNTSISDELHAFLCSTPTLLHLIAPNVPYFAEYFDLSNPTTAEGYCYLQSCAPGRPVFQTESFKKQIWACRGLRTLQLRFISKSQDYASVENARIMFDYISRVCPNLRELAINRVALYLKLKGGLCLLSRLRHLQKLTISTWGMMKLDVKDMEWMSRYPTARDLSKPCNSLSTETILEEGNTLHTGPSSRELTAKDLRDIGSISNLEACQKQLVRGLGNEGCLPELEFLRMRLPFFLFEESDRINRKEHLRDLFAKIRPCVEFICDGTAN